MKKILIALSIMSYSFIINAATIDCKNEENTVNVSLVSTEMGTKLILDNIELECTSNSKTDCLAIDFSTAGAYQLTTNLEKNTGVLEILPPPGSGLIKELKLICNEK
jgi:hypothetical protein